MMILLIYIAGVSIARLGMYAVGQVDFMLPYLRYREYIGNNFDSLKLYYTLLLHKLTSVKMN